MTRNLLLLLAFVGIAPAVLLAAFNLVAFTWSVFSPRRQLSLSARIYSRDGRSWDLEPTLHLSVATSCLILVGASLLVLGLWRIRPELFLKPNHLPSSQSKSD